MPQGIQIEILTDSSIITSGNFSPSNILYKNETGVFYPNYNPSGFITGGGGGQATNPIIFSVGNDFPKMYLSQKGNSEVVWGYNVNPQNDNIDISSNSAMKFSMQGTGGYNGLELQHRNANGGNWSAARTLWNVNQNGDITFFGSLYCNGDNSNNNFGSNSTVSATRFIGDGSELSNLPAGDLSVGNTLYVDSIYGNDSIAERQKINKPFLTLSGAKNAAISGDLIHVGPGNYIANDSILKNGVDWYFDSPSIVTRLHTPLITTGVLSVSGYDGTENSMVVTDNITVYIIEFINTDNNPEQTPAFGNGVVYFTTLDIGSDSVILAAFIDALNTGTGFTSSTSPTAPGTIAQFIFTVSENTIHGHASDAALISLPSPLPGFSIINAQPGTSDSTALIGDSGDSIKSNINGMSTFIYDMTNYSSNTFPVNPPDTFGCVVLSGNSDIKLNCQKISMIGGTSIFNSNIYTDGNLKLIADVEELVSENTNLDVAGYGVWWKAGKVSINADFIRRSLVGVTSECHNASFGDLYVNAQTISNSVTYSNGYGAILSDGTDTNAAAWITAKTVSGALGTPSVQTVFGNKLYVDAQKLYGSVLCNGGLMYVNSDKIVPLPNQFFRNNMIELNAGQSFINITHNDPSTFPACLLLMNGGTGNVQLTNYIGNSISSGILISGGVLNLNNSRINTSANSLCNTVVKNSGNLILKNCDLISNTGKLSISGSVGQIVKSYGFNMANTNIRSGIILSPSGGFTVDSNVT